MRGPEVNWHLVVGVPVRYSLNAVFGLESPDSQCATHCQCVRPQPPVPRASPRPPMHYGSAVGERALLKTANLTRGRPSRSQPPTRHSRRIATRSFALPTDFGTGRLFRRLTASAARSLRTRFCAATCALSGSASEFHRNDPDLGSRGRSWFEGSPQVWLRPTC